MFLSSKPRDADCFILVSTETLLSASGRIFCINSESVSTVFPCRCLLNLNSKNKRINSKLGPPYYSKVPESPRPPSVFLLISFFQVLATSSIGAPLFPSLPLHPSSYLSFLVEIPTTLGVKIKVPKSKDSLPVFINIFSFNAQCTSNRLPSGPALSFLIPFLSY